MATGEQGVVRPVSEETSVEQPKAVVGWVPTATGAPGYERLFTSERDPDNLTRGPVS